MIPGASDSSRAGNCRTDLAYTFPDNQSSDQIESKHSSKMEAAQVVMAIGRPNVSHKDNDVSLFLQQNGSQNVALIILRAIESCYIKIGNRDLRITR